MSLYKSLIEQYVTLYFCLGNLPESATEAEVDAVMPLHSAAYQLLMDRESALPDRRGRIDDIEHDNYELCADDVEMTVLEGRLVHGISFFAGGPISNATARALCGAVLQAYEDARAAAGQPELSVRFVQAQRQNVMRVSETNAFDLDAPEPVDPAQ